MKCWRHTFLTAPLVTPVLHGMCGRLQSRSRCLAFAGKTRPRVSTSLTRSQPQKRDQSSLCWGGLPALLPPQRFFLSSGHRVKPSSWQLSPFLWTDLSPIFTLFHGRLFCGLPPLLPPCSLSPQKEYKWRDESTVIEYSFLSLSKASSRFTRSEFRMLLSKNFNSKVPWDVFSEISTSWKLCCFWNLTFSSCSGFIKPNLLFAWEVMLYGGVRRD